MAVIIQGTKTTPGPWSTPPPGPWSTPPPGPWSTPPPGPWSTPPRTMVDSPPDHGRPLPPGPWLTPPPGAMVDSPPRTMVDPSPRGHGRPLPPGPWSTPPPGAMVDPSPRGHGRPLPPDHGQPLSPRTMVDSPPPEPWSTPLAKLHMPLGWASLHVPNACNNCSFMLYFYLCDSLLRRNHRWESGRATGWVSGEGVSEWESEWGSGWVGVLRHVGAVMIVHLLIGSLLRASVYLLVPYYRCTLRCTYRMTLGRYLLYWTLPTAAWSRCFPVCCQQF